MDYVVRNMYIFWQLKRILLSPLRNGISSNSGLNIISVLTKQTNREESKVGFGFNENKRRVNTFILSWVNALCFNGIGAGQSTQFFSSN